MAIIPVRIINAPAETVYDTQWYGTPGKVYETKLGATIQRDFGRPFAGKSKLVNGWRKPTTMRAWDIRVTWNAYDYQLPKPYDSHYWGNRGSNPKPYFGWGTSGPAGARLPVLNATTYARSITQARAKASRQEVNYATFFAEFGKTAQMVVNRAVVLAQTLSKYKRYRTRLLKLFGETRALEAAIKSGTNLRRNRTRLARTRALLRRVEFNVVRDTPLIARKAKSRSGAYWLEYQYGWAPLISDLVEISDHLKDGLDMRPAVHVTSMVTEDYPMPNNGSTGPRWVSGSWKCGAFTRLDYRISNPSLHALTQTGLTNPFLTMWELVPFSFLVDWLMPIGTWLEATTASLGLTFLGGSTTSKNWGSCVVDLHRRAPRAGIPYAFYESKCLRREVHTVQPFPLPYIRNPLSSLTRVANLAALLQNLQKRR